VIIQLETPLGRSIFTTTMANVSQPSPVLDLEGLGRMFYIASPSATSFPDLKAIPKSYVDQAMPYFFIMTLLEWAVLAAKGKMPRLNDGLFSIVHGLIMTLMEYLVKGVLFSAYLYIHANYCLYRLPWDSPLTWVIAAFAIDFCYYWVHRSAHEINVLWAAHQVHHSSEDYNLTTALRQSAFQGFGSWPLYLPMAFFVPPAQAVIHKELNLLYQFWIHTELVQSIGPLEWVLNTASHHRVHHGANRYCLDKNYAGVLIIWDRMFGTFEAERSDVKIVYGLVDQPQFWNPVWHQLHYYHNVWKKACSMPDWTSFVSAFVKGPGWFPGTPRLGDISFVPENPVRDKYDPEHSSLLHMYTIPHFLLAFLAVEAVAQGNAGLTQATSLLMIGYILWTLTNFGLLYEGNKSAWPVELTRILITLALLPQVPGVASHGPLTPNLLQGVFVASGCLAASASIARLFSKEAKIAKME